MANETNSKALSFIKSTLDANSFVEIGSMILPRSTDFNVNNKSVKGDGVICGYGLIDDRLVYISAINSAVLGGSIGEMNAKKIANIYDMAIKMGAPVIEFIDSTGIRLEESIDALSGLGTIYSKKSAASGVVPMISVVDGNCGGGIAISTEISDFVFMNEKAALFVNSPNAIEGNHVSETDNSSAEFQNCISGNVDFVYSEDIMPSKVREFIKLLPNNNMDNEGFSSTDDDLNRVCNKTLHSDPALLLTEVSDNGTFIETKKKYGRDILTGFIRLAGQTVGVIANRSEMYENGEKIYAGDNKLSYKGLNKAVKFIKFLDAFNLPLLTVTNVSGFRTTLKNEEKVARRAAEFVANLCQSNIPKVNLITDEAIGSAYTIMNSKSVGADIVYAFDNAKISIMDASLAAKVIAKDKENKSEISNEFNKLQGSVVTAAKHGEVDTIISEENTRKYLIGAFEMLFTKSDVLCDKKHITL